MLEYKGEGKNPVFIKTGGAPVMGGSQVDTAIISFADGQAPNRLLDDQGHPIIARGTHF